MVNDPKDSPTDFLQELLENEGDAESPLPADLEASPALLIRLEILSALESLSELAAAEERGFPDIKALKRYEVRGLLGSGGFGSVYAAFDTVLQREVAVKILRLPPSEAAYIDDWAVSEGRSLARTSHPSVVTIFDVQVEQDGLAFIVMELVQGPSLYEVLSTWSTIKSGRGTTDLAPLTRRVAGTLSPMAARIRLIRDLARALHQCHTQGVLHRDVKPANVLVDVEGRPILIDFGIAHAPGCQTRDLSGRTVGTVEYLAPELLAGGNSVPDQATDQFSLAALMLELLTGHHPFRRGSATESRQAIASDRPTLPRELARSLPNQIWEIARHGMEHNPSNRYPSLEAMAMDLDQVLEHRSTSLESRSLVRRMVHWVHRNRWRAAAAATLFALGTFLLGVWLFGWLLRSELRQEIRSLASQAEQASSPSEYVDFWADQRSVRTRAEILDDSLLAGFLFSSLKGRAIEAGERGCESLHDQLDGLYSSAQSKPQWSQRNEELMDISMMWRHALDGCRALCSLGPIAESHHGFGSVHFAGAVDLRVFSSIRSPTEPLLTPVDPTADLDPGYYRVSRPTTGPWLNERDFVLTGFAPSWDPSPLTPDAAVRNQMVIVDLDNSKSFGISSTPIQWGLAVQFLSGNERLYVEAMHEHWFGSHLALDQPAILPWFLAQAFAERTGTRLPGPEEYLAAHRAGVLGGGEELESEWVFAVPLHEQQYRFKASLKELDHLRSEPGTWLEHCPLGSFDKNAGFRVVLGRR